MRNCNKIITVRLTDEEYNHCVLMAKGNKSFYVRNLINNDIHTNTTLSKESIIKIIEDYLQQEKFPEQQPLTPVKQEHTKIAKQVIADIFNF